jgi:hypothetical protein
MMCDHSTFNMLIVILSDISNEYKCIDAHRRYMTVRGTETAMKCKSKMRYQILCWLWIVTASKSGTQHYLIMSSFQGCHETY